MKNKKHTLYSGLTCPPCVVVKQAIQHLKLEDKVDILYVNKDISLNEFKNLGLRTTPSLISSDGQVIVNSLNIINFLKTQNHD